MVQLKSKKPVVIYFDGGAMGGGVTGELKNNKLAIKTIGNDGGIDISIDVTKEKLSEFWKKVDELNVWNWRRNYNEGGYAPVCDGYTWELKLRSPDGKTLYSGAVHEFPDNFDDFAEVINKLFENKLNQEIIELDDEE